MPRYLFVLPDVDAPTGGNIVAMQMAQILRDAGYEAGVVNGRDGYEYKFLDGALQPYFYPPLSDISGQFIRRRERICNYVRALFTTRKSNRNPQLNVLPDDVFVVPEFWYPEYCALFPNNKRILFSQALLAFCKALHRDIESGSDFIDEFVAIVTISEATKATVQKYAGRDSFMVSQSIVRPTLNSTVPKKQKIAYMPRRRPKEAHVLVSCLQKKPVFAGWEFCALENLKLDEVDKILSESLIFLSFPAQQEGFGRPPAEAMAAGCITVGYAGVGATEFFHSKTGVLVPDGDINSFATALEQVIIEYTQDPTRLDELRQSAAAHIASHYNPEVMRAMLLRVWEEIDKLVNS